MELNNNFNFFVPLEFEKGSSASKEMKIRGICSSQSEDSDGETLYPAGFNVTPLLATGFLNYNHQASKSAAAIIGEPTKAEIINDGRDLYIEGFLYADSDEAKAVYKLAQTLEKNSPSRRLGFSIEGKATKRDPLNQKRILAADITSVAITACPKNPNTLLSIMKGEYSQPLVANETEELEDETKKSITTDTGDTGEGGLQVESVEGGKKVIDSIINADRTVNEPKKLKKSEVYSEIIKAYPFAEFEKAKEIYTFIETVNQKLFNMPNTDTEVLSEALQKSFDILNQEFDSLVKSKEAEVAATAAPEVTPAAEVTPATTLEKSDDVKDLDGDDEICSMAKKRIEKGMSADEATADLVSKGVSLTVAQTAVAKIISEVEALDAQGDKTNGTAVTAPVVKSDDTNDIIKASEPVALDLTPIEDLIKSQSEVFENLIKGQSDQIGQRFSGIGQILKSMNEENLNLRKDNTALQNTQVELIKSIDAIALRLNTVEKTPVRNNTILTKTAVDKFAKSDDADGQVFSLSSKEDRDLLSDRLLEEYEVSKGRGRQDTVLEKAITDLDMVGGFQAQTLQALYPRLRAMKINVVE